VVPRISHLSADVDSSVVLTFLLKEVINENIMITITINMIMGIIWNLENAFLGLIILSEKIIKKKKINGFSKIWYYLLPMCSQAMHHYHLLRLRMMLWMYILRMIREDPYILVLVYNIFHLHLNL